MEAARHLSASKLEKGVEHILATPKDDGELKLIVCRPEIDGRETPIEARLDVFICRVLRAACQLLVMLIPPAG